jgi:hypothetical protein
MVIAFIQAATEEGVRVGTSAMTVLEADYARVHPARIAWVLSRIDVHDINRAEPADRRRRRRRSSLRPDTSDCCCG